MGLLRLFWFYSDRIIEGELWSQRVLALPPPVSATVTPAAIPFGRSLAHLGYAILQFYKGHFDPAPLAESVHHFQTLGDAAHLCDALSWLSFTRPGWAKRKHWRWPGRRLSRVWNSAKKRLSNSGNGIALSTVVAGQARTYRYHRLMRINKIKR